MTTNQDFLALVRNRQPVVLEEGTTLFRIGEPATKMYIVKTGMIRLHAGDVTYELVDDGGVFGEMALIDHLPRSATATAVIPTEVIELDEGQFMALVRQVPSFSLNMLRVVTRRLRAMDDRATAGKQA